MGTLPRLRLLVECVRPLRGTVGVSPAPEPLPDASRGGSQDARFLLAVPCHVCTLYAPILWSGGVWKTEFDGCTVGTVMSCRRCPLKLRFPVLPLPHQPVMTPEL